MHAKPTIIANTQASAGAPAYVCNKLAPAGYIVWLPVTGLRASFTIQRVATANVSIVSTKLPLAPANVSIASTKLPPVPANVSIASTNLPPVPANELTASATAPITAYTLPVLRRLWPYFPVKPQYIFNPHNF